MPSDTVQDLLSDLVALLTHLHEAVAHQLRSAPLDPHEDARDLLARLEPRLFGQIEPLKQALERLGGRPGIVKEKVAALLGAAAGLLERTRSRRVVSRDLRDDYVVLSLILVNYGMLTAAATRLGDEQTLDLASAHIDQLAVLHDDLSMVLPEVVEEELGLD